LPSDSGGIRTHLNADVRWTSAATSSKTGGYLDLIESLIHTAKYHPTGVVFLLAEDEKGFERTAPVRTLV